MAERLCKTSVSFQFNYPLARVCAPFIENYERTLSKYIILEGMTTASQRERVVCLVRTSRCFMITNADKSVEPFRTTIKNRSCPNLFRNKLSVIPLFLTLIILIFYFSTFLPKWIKISIISPSSCTTDVAAMKVQPFAEVQFLSWLML